MNQQMYRWICITGVTTAITTVAVFAQQAPTVETKVISLENVDAQSVTVAVSQLEIHNLDTVVSAGHVGKIILQGSHDALKLAESVITELDRRPGGSDRRRAPKTEFVTVHSYPLMEMHKLVRTSLDLDGPTAIAPDQINNRIIVTGSEKDIVAVRSLVKKLDRPRRTYTIELYFIRSGGEGERIPLPEAMQPIAASLAKSGFGELSLLKPMIVRVDDGGVFEQRARHSIWHDGARPEEIELGVMGEVQSAQEGDALRIELQAEMMGVNHQKSESTASFELNTQLSIPQGRFVVLAAAPASTRDSDAIALVIRVTSGSFD